MQVFVIFSLAWVALSAHNEEMNCESGLEHDGGDHDDSALLQVHVTSKRNEVHRDLQESSENVTKSKPFWSTSQIPWMKNNPFMRLKKILTKDWENYNWAM